ncbi:MAG: CHC2 zinc finger domain-containing protein [Limisphaerales bacterium]
MPKSPYVDFKAVKEALKMEQVLDRYGLMHQFKRSGDSLSGPCPIHKGSNPTQFRVSITKNIWNCFSECKHGGNVLDFIAEMEKVSIHAAAVKAIEWFNLDADAVTGRKEEEHQPEQADEKQDKPAPQKPKPAAKLAAKAEDTSGPNKPLKFRLDKLDQAHPYLAERGLLPETIKEFGIGYCAKGMMTGRIAIPICNAEGAVVAYAGRFAGEADKDTEKYKLPPGFRKTLEIFNVERAFKEPKDKALVIVEGFFGSMLMHQHGYKKVIALMGSSMSDVQEKIIREHTDQNSRIVIVFDEDESGRTGREDIAVRLSKFTFVKTHVFAEENYQAEDLTIEEVKALIV